MMSSTSMYTAVSNICICKTFHQGLQQHSTVYYKNKIKKKNFCVQRFELGLGTDSYSKCDRQILTIPGKVTGLKFSRSF